ncbi:MAG TPA: holo-ACP synthase [Phycisphaerae bacterium]|nr:holo-ACP synthase [Phycisphaerae bacterium]HPS52687.1 holo-ACP synthase [Phycisphaerae bacterium]
MSETVLAHGIDLVDVPRLSQSIERFGEKFLDRVFTEFEQQYCDSRQKSAMVSYAGRFAVKEAVLKVLGTGWRDGIAWTDVEVRNLPSGQPVVKLYNKCDEIARELGIEKIFISISHVDSAAVGSAVAVGRAAK